MLPFQPHEALRSRVLDIRVVESDGGETTVLPAAAAVLGFQYRGRVRAEEGVLSVAGVTGLSSGPRRYTYEPGTASILVRFTPQGAACLGVPASELAGRSVPLDALLAPARVHELSQRLLDASRLDERLALVQALLLELPFAPDRLVARAVARLSAPGTVAIAQVARELGISERQLERRFLARVGLTPKRFATLRRFERALALAGSAPSLGQLAQEAGYYDQSHFIREFRAFAGAPPARLLGAR